MSLMLKLFNCSWLVKFCRLTARRAGASLLRLGVLVAVMLAQVVTRAAEPRVNLLFLMTDQHHADWLACAGNPVVKTPNLDRLAAGGARFTRMFVPVPYCSPTRAAVVTGEYPSKLGIGRNINEKNDPLRLREPKQTYMHQLAAQGYHCHQLGKWHLGETTELSCYPEDDQKAFAGLMKKRLQAAGDQKFDSGPREGESELVQNVYMRTEVAAAHRKWSKEPGTPQQDTGVIGRYRMKPEFTYEAMLADYCISLLKRHEHEPFAITYSVSPPHAPWIAPAPYYDMYDPAKMPLPATWSAVPEAWKSAGAVRMAKIYGEAGFREYVRCYAAQVTMMDAFMGRILAALDELKLTDHTLIVFTSDHGNMLGQHGMMDKTVATFYDDLMRVPLLLSLPGQIQPGQVCERFATTVDLAPTILDYLGGAPLAQARGRSLRGVLAGTTPDMPAVFGERAEPKSKAAGRMVRTRQWKLCLLPKGAHELYNLEKDPQETTNVFGDPAHAAVVKELRALLQRHMQEVGDQADFATIAGR